MEIGDSIVGSKLSEIQKRPDQVKLVFQNSKLDKGYVLTFKGLLFETAGSSLNKKVRRAEINNTLGFRATSQLRQMDRDPKNYRQLFIQMEGSGDIDKFELLGAVRTYKLSSRKLTRVLKAG